MLISYSFFVTSFNCFLFLTPCKILQGGLTFFLLHMPQCWAPVPVTALTTALQWASLFSVSLSGLFPDLHRSFRPACTICPLNHTIRMLTHAKTFSVVTSTYIHKSQTRTSSPMHLLFWITFRTDSWPWINFLKYVSVWSCLVSLPPFWFGSFS